MLENIIVVVIVATVALMVGRSFYRTMPGKNEGCGCGVNCGVAPTRISPGLIKDGMPTNDGLRIVD